MLQKMLLDSMDQWEIMLPTGLWVYRTSYKVSVGSTPFKLLYGQEAILPFEFGVPSLRIAVRKGLVPEHSFAYKMDQLRQLDEQRYHSFLLLQEVQSRQKKWHDRNLRTKIFRPGDLVLYFHSKMIGPFRIHAMCGPGSFRLAMLAGEVLLTVINGFKLRAYQIFGG
ncbi:hypothetical protein KP509_04G098600 [Ceratopteris richardii]|uniref:Uncharacterized protein n=1 Tax=Ceratopteris richardii TaxID=49495 RepID=A0A8T2V7I6_CERRI|nr:hypothetical protein KP509_04G098600 [Ceratopteris richardii]